MDVKYLLSLDVPYKDIVRMIKLYAVWTAIVASVQLTFVLESVTLSVLGLVTILATSHELWLEYERPVQMQYG